MRIADATILILPGLGDSGPGHWQRRWADRIATARIVAQDDWLHPRREDWTAAISAAIAASTRPVVLIAHSLGVSALVHAARDIGDGKVRGALLVAPPDHEADTIPPEVHSFASVPRDPLPFPSLLVASTDDPWCSVERAADFAACWGSDLHLAGPAGHINLASGHGPWPEGLLMLTRLMQRI